MLKKCDDRSIERVVDYIGEEKTKCFYLYADLVTYGTQEPHFSLWTDEDEKGAIIGVAYRYYETLHLFSHDIFPAEDALTLIGQLRPKCITGPQDSIKPLQEKLEESYTLEFSYIIEADHLLKCRDNLRVTKASKEDLSAVAEMMMKDPIYTKVYTYEALYEQMLDRFTSGTGRMLVLKDRNGRVLAASETNVETEDIVVMGVTIADVSVKGFGFGSMIAAYAWNLIMREGKRPLGFTSVNNTEAISMNEGMGIKLSGVYARLLRKD